MSYRRILGGGLKIAVVTAFLSLTNPRAIAMNQFLIPQCSTPTSCTFGGLLHTAVGSARLSIVNGNLVVSNIGSGGLDGFTVEVPEVLDWDVEMSEIDPAHFPIGGYYNITSHATLQGIPNQVMSNIRDERVSSGLFEWTGSYPSATPTSQSASYLLGGTQFLTESFGSGALTYTSSRMSTGDCTDCVSPQLWSLHSTYSGSQSVTTPSSAVVTLDRMNLLADFSGISGGRITSVTWTAANLSSVTIVSETTDPPVSMPVISTLGATVLAIALAAMGLFMILRKARPALSA